MDTTTWIATIALAAMFAVAGIAKLATPKNKLYENGMTYVEDFPDNTIKLIGGLEILAVAGLILPALLDILPILVPITAICCLLTMIGAVIVHLRRGEKQIVLPVALGGLALFVAIMRFGPERF